MGFGLISGVYDGCSHASIKMARIYIHGGHVSDLREFHRYRPSSTVHPLLSNKHFIFFFFKLYLYIQAPHQKPRAVCA
jgi:hypothetical protein